MKKILTILLVSLMVLSLTGCNSKKEEPQKVEKPVVQETVKEETPVVEEKPTVEETAPVEVVEEVKEEKVDVTELSYWVNFLNYDGSVISRKAYKYGSTPVAPLNPTYEDGVIYYNFLKWDKKLTPVYGTQTYTALYEKTGYVHNNHNDEVSAPAPDAPEVTAADALTTNAEYELIWVYYDFIDSANINYSMTYKKTESGFDVSKIMINNRDYTHEQGYVEVCLSSSNGSYIYFDFTDSSLLRFAIDTNTNVYTITGALAQYATLTSFSVKPTGASEFTEITLLPAIGHAFGNYSPLRFKDFTPSSETTIRDIQDEILIFKYEDQEYEGRLIIDGEDYFVLFEDLIDNWLGSGNVPLEAYLFTTDFRTVTIDTPISSVVYALPFDAS